MADEARSFDALIASQMPWGLKPGAYTVETRGDIVTAIYPKGPTLPPPDPRISRERMFLEIASVIRNRSSCLRGKVGCVIVQDGRIVSMGYNGSPPDSPHCFELGCDVDENDHEAGCQRTIHAETNAILWAARSGVKVDGAEMYCTHSPCGKCAQNIVMAGITAFHFELPYRLGRLDILRDGMVQIYDKNGNDAHPG